MPDIACTGALCAYLITLGYGTTQDVVPFKDPIVGKAVYHQGCEANFQSIETGCSTVVKQWDFLWKKCSDGKIECYHLYDKPKWVNLGPTQTLPPVYVSPKPEKPRVKVRPKPSQNGVASKTAITSTPGQSIPAQIATQLGRQGATSLAQAKAGVLGFGLGGIGGAIAASWMACGAMKYAFLRYDYAKKERWDLHPDIDQRNQLYVTKMCSPAGFLFRMEEAKEPHEKFLALMGGLTWFTDPLVNLLGQLAPVAPSAINNVKLVANAFGAPKPKHRKNEHN